MGSIKRKIILTILSLVFSIFAGVIMGQQTIEDKKAIAYNKFTQAGYAPHHAAAIIGNLEHESGLNTGAVGDQGKAKGIAQWHPDRWRTLEQFAKGGNPYDFSTQVDFIIHELDNNEKRAKAKLMETKSLPEAVQSFNYFYERSKDSRGGKEPILVKARTNRMNYSINAYNNYAAGNPIPKGGDYEETGIGVRRPVSQAPAFNNAYTIANLNANILLGLREEEVIPRYDYYNKDYIKLVALEKKKKQERNEVDEDLLSVLSEDDLQNIINQSVEDGEIKKEIAQEKSPVIQQAEIAQAGVEKYLFERQVMLSINDNTVPKV